MKIDIRSDEMTASLPNPSAPRDLLAGRYRLLDSLGSGGSSSVYRAWDEQLSVFRAVKILDGAVAHNPRIRKRLLQEAEVMARLQHPNVVTLHHAGADGHQLYIVMELMLGGSMMERLSEDGPLPPRMAVHVLNGVLAALQLAHDNGIVHRDVKPHNILLDAHGTPKVTDFGIARWEDGGLTRTGAVLGTLAYMPPEQKLSARSVDLRSDLYAVGATLYALLTGRMPHDLYAAGLDPTIARDLFAGIAPSMVEVIRRATAFRSVDRYASALAMQAALASAVADLPEDPPGPPLVSPHRLGRARSQVRLGPTLMGTTESAEQTHIASAENTTTVDASAPVRGVGTLVVGVVGVAAIYTLVWLVLSAADAQPTAIGEVLPPLRQAPSRPVLEPGFSVVTGEPAVDRLPAPRHRRRVPPPEQTADAMVVVAPIAEPYRQTVGRWTIEQWPTGRSRSDVVATLSADDEIVNPDGTRVRPDLVLRCAAKRPYAVLRTGLTAVDTDRGTVDVEVAGGFVQELEMEPDPTLRGELLFPRPADWIGRILDAGAPLAFRYTASSGTETRVVFTVGDTARVADALHACR